jgi:uncharacterized membrane protein
MKKKRDHKSGLRGFEGLPGGHQFDFASWLTPLLLTAGAVVYIALRVLSVWTPRLWGDELFNYSLSQGSWISLVKRAGLDMAHPPLFYVVLKLWIYLTGSSMAGLRVLTVALSIAALIPFFILGRELLLRTRELALALSLMAINNYLILYSYYLRSYSLLLFLTLCSDVAFLRFLRRDESNKNRTLLILVVVNVLFVYTHYFAWLVVIAQFLWVMFMARNHLRGLTVAAVITILCFLPWVGVIVYVSTQVSYTILDQAHWYWPPGISSVVMLLRCFNGGFQSKWLTLGGSGLFLLLAVIPVAGFALSSRETRPGETAKLKPLVLLAWLTVFPIVVSLVSAHELTWVWEPRYVIVSAVPYLLLVAASAFRLPRPQAQAAAVVFLLGWSVLAGWRGDLAEALHGPNAPSYWLARDLSLTEMQTTGPIKIYGLSPYAEQGLRLALNLTGEWRFETVTCPVNASLPDNYFWIAVTEHDPLAAARLKELAADPVYSLGEPICSGQPPERHIVIPVRRK